jgi:hypothetical protein
MENIDTRIWGKSFWQMCHFITFSYPNEPTEIDKNNIKQFFELLKHLLPCTFCRSHYNKNIQLTPLTDEILDTKFLLILWCIKLHNTVNLQINKKEISLEDSLIALFFDNFIEKHTECEHNYNNIETLDEEEIKQYFKVSTIPYFNNSNLNIPIHEILNVYKKQRYLDEEFNKYNTDKGDIKIEKKTDDILKKENEIFINTVGLPEVSHFHTIVGNDLQTLNINILASKIKTLFDQQTNNDNKKIIKRNYQIMIQCICPV